MSLTASLDHGTKDNSSVGKIFSYGVCLYSFFVAMHYGVTLAVTMYTMLFVFLAVLIGSVFAGIVTFIVGAATLYLVANVVVVGSSMVAGAAFYAADWISTKVSKSVKSIKGFFTRKK